MPDAEGGDEGTAMLHAETYEGAIRVAVRVLGLRSPRDAAAGPDGLASRTARAAHDHPTPLTLAPARHHHLGGNYARLGPPLLEKHAVQVCRNLVSRERLPRVGLGHTPRPASPLGRLLRIYVVRQPVTDPRLFKHRCLQQRREPGEVRALRTITAQLGQEALVSLLHPEYEQRAKARVRRLHQLVGQRVADQGAGDFVHVACHLATFRWVGDANHERGGVDQRIRHDD